ncbi:MAG TPA: DMT family transporter [Spirochaetales bacterium]|nr:DMT family transporter [Spirochaetales bacterium]HRY53154.1 DMT family transporter [Spirochaetia bacterium]HRZ63305.1 DMT family transporter [Spirochaetia bacterium]
MERIGELAAFGTAICWTASAIFFERASKRIGALAVNFYKVCAAFAFLAAAGFLLRGSPLPLDATPRAWAYLAVSGVVGFLVADYFLFNAYILVGSRLTVLFQPLTPLFAALLGYLVLGERMRSAGLVGMVLVAAGILIVIASRNASRGELAGGPAAVGKGGAARLDPRTAKGLAFALASALFQAVGLIFTKIGVEGYDAIAGTQIRVATAIVGFALQGIVTGGARKLFVEARRDREAMKATAVGAVFGPFVGVTLSLVALKATSAGAASTLMGLTPVLIIPPSILLLKQRVRPLEIAGACVACAGAALFFLL